MEGSESGDIKFYDFETELEEMAAGDPEAVKSKQERSAEFWRGQEIATEGLLSSVEVILKKRSIEMHDKPIEHIDSTKRAHLLRFELEVEMANNWFSEKRAEGSPAQQEMWKEFQERFNNDAAVARERIEDFYNQYRADVLDGAYTPLWRRQKFWGVVCGTFFAGAAGTAALIMAITRATVDPNAQRAAARVQLLEQELALDPALATKVKEAAAKLEIALDTRAFTTYLPWLRSVTAQFALGLLTLRDLMLDFGATPPMHPPVGDEKAQPFTPQELTAIEKAMVDAYRTSSAPSYDLVFAALVAEGDKRPDIKQLTAPQLNYFLVAVLTELRTRFADGTANPPVRS